MKKQKVWDDPKNESIVTVNYHPPLLERILCALVQNSNTYPRMGELGVIMEAKKIEKEYEEQKKSGN